MLEKRTMRFVCLSVLLCLAPLTFLPRGWASSAGQKPDLIELRIKVTDKKNAEGIDNADVLVKWGEGRDSESGTATTNAKGIANLRNVPQGMVAIRVIASGYRVTALKVDLKTEKLPVKIELDKETVGTEE
jgi:hypothetical protein